MSEMQERNDGHIHCAHKFLLPHGSDSLWRCCRCSAEAEDFPLLGWQRAKEPEGNVKEQGVANA